MQTIFSLKPCIENVNSIKAWIIARHERRKRGLLRAIFALPLGLSSVPLSVFTLAPEFMFLDCAVPNLDHEATYAITGTVEVYSNQITDYILEGLTYKDLDCLPFGVAVPIREALHQSAADPPLTLPTGAYQLIGKYIQSSILFLFLLPQRSVS